MIAAHLAHQQEWCDWAQRFENKREF